MEKGKLIGEEVIVCDGDFKGVKGILFQLTIEPEETYDVKGSSTGKILQTFIAKTSDVICSIHVNQRNIITVSIKDIIKVE